MKRYLYYLRYVLKHKAYVFYFCVIRYGLIWRGLTHDMSKLFPSEFIPYARFFYARDGAQMQRRDKTGYYRPDTTGDAAFDKAWCLHQQRNDHHWQWWFLVDAYTCPCTSTEGAAEWASVGRSPSPKSSARSAGSCVPALISSTAESCATSAASTTRSDTTTTTSSTSTNDGSGIGTETHATPKHTVGGSERTATATAVRCSSTTAEANPSAHAAVRLPTSSSPSTTRTAGATSTGAPRSRAMRAYIRIAGWFATIFRRSSACSATTATAPTPSTALVRISKTSLLLTEDAQIRCMLCGKRHDLNAIRGRWQLLEMSDGARKEMLADWMGAGRAQGNGNDVLPWYMKNKDKLILGPATREWVEDQLGVCWACSREAALNAAAKPGNVFTYGRGYHKGVNCRFNSDLGEKA